MAAKRLGILALALLAFISCTLTAAATVKYINYYDIGAIYKIEDDGVPTYSYHKYQLTEDVPLSAYDLNLSGYYGWSFEKLLTTNTNLFTLIAKGSDGRLFENESSNLIIYVDAEAPLVTSIAPTNNSVITESQFNISIKFNEPVELTNSVFKFDNNDLDFHYVYGKPSEIISDTIEATGDGQFVFTFTIYDPAGNHRTYTYVYTIDRPLHIELHIPDKELKTLDKTSGITIGVKTNKNASCRYFVDQDEDQEYSYGQMYAFSTTGGLTHERSGISLLDNSSYYLKVKCDREGEIYGEVFEILVDATQPKITLTASDITSPRLPLTNIISVESDDDVVCKYDLEDKSYQDMANKFYSDDDDTEYDSYKNDPQTEVDGLEDKKSYTFYIVCRNRAGLVTDDSVSFIVDTEAGGTVTLITPTSVESESFKVKLVANPEPESCGYKLDSQTSYTDLQDQGDGLTFQSNTVQVTLGDHRLYYRCSFQTGMGVVHNVQFKNFIFDNTPPNKISADDTIGTSPEPEKSPYNNKLHLKINSEDNETDIVRYNYSMYQLNGSLPIEKDDISNSKKIIDWDTTNKDSFWVKEDSSGEDLFLKENQTFFFAAYSMNEAYLWSVLNISDGITIDTSILHSYCSNLKFDYGSESDVDCGINCGPCANGKSCFTDTDCLSEYCYNKVCKEQSCSDGIQNNDESDVDCGGIVCPKCSVDKNCSKDTDCLSNKCTLGKCQTADSCFNGIKDINEPDVDCGSVCTKKCAVGQSCYTGSDCQTNLCKDNKCGDAADPNDWDGDGIPNNEDMCPNDPRGHKDFDGDGICDYLDLDDDNDGIPDAWEIAHGLNPLNPDDANKINEEEGITYLEQYKSSEKSGEEEEPSELDEGSGLWWKIILILIILVIAAIVGLHFYQEKQSPKPLSAPPAPNRPMGPTPAKRMPSQPQRGHPMGPPMRTGPKKDFSGRKQQMRKLQTTFGDRTKTGSIKRMQAKSPIKGIQTKIPIKGMQTKLQVAPTKAAPTQPQTQPKKKAKKTKKDEQADKTLEDLKKIAKK